MRISASQLASSLVGGSILAMAVAHTSAQDTLKSTPVNNDDNGFTLIEGPAVDQDGTLFFAYRAQKDGKTVGRISRLAPGANKSEQFVELKPGRIGNGIRFDKEGRMYVADFKGHNILMFEKGSKVEKVYFPTNNSAGAKFNQPNDLAMGNDGTLYVSDPLRKGQITTGQIWRITRDPSGKALGKVMTSDRKGAMGVTNGIDLSPDGTTLYVGESTTGQIWAYRIKGNHLSSLSGPTTPMTTVKGGELDGLRTDVKGRIYVAQNGARKIAIVTPMSKDTPKTIETHGNEPSNLTFGGPDGMTLFITQGEGGLVESVRVDTPGREPCPALKSPTVCSSP